MLFWDENLLWFLTDKKNLFWANKRFVHFIFIGQRISYLRHYVHVRKLYDDMNKSNGAYLFQYCRSQVLEERLVYGEIFQHQGWGAEPRNYRKEVKKQSLLNIDWY